MCYVSKSLIDNDDKETLKQQSSELTVTLSSVKTAYDKLMSIEKRSDVEETLNMAHEETQTALQSISDKIEDLRFDIRSISTSSSST